MARQVFPQRLPISAQSNCPEEHDGEPEEEEPSQVEPGPQLRREAEKEEVDALLGRQSARLERTEQAVQGGNAEELRKELLMSDLREPGAGEGEEKCSYRGGKCGETKAPAQEGEHGHEVQRQNRDHPELEGGVGSEL